MGKKSAPKPPDPQETAAAQTGTNVSTAVANAALGNVNQVTPEGRLNYDVTGEYGWTDPSTGETYSIPTYTATTELSPEQQNLFNLGQQTQGNLAQIGVDQSQRIGELLGTPVDLSNDAVESRLFDLGRKRLDPYFAESQDKLRTQLANQGIQQGSEAYDRSMRNFYQGRNDAYNQLLLGGHGQAVQEALTARNQPINEITALLSGSQVSQPNFAGTNMPQIPTTDYAGIVNQDYQNRLMQSQMNNQFGSQLLGGLFQLGGGALAGGYFGRSPKP